jgi:hypothetical protein
MKFTVLVASLLVVGCSHLKQEDKVAVELPFAPELVAEMQKRVGRAPANFEATEEGGKSPRRVYFSALYHQYLILGSHLGQTSDLRSCPQFHHDKIETDSFITPTFTIPQNSRVGSEGRAFFPELVFTKDFSLTDHLQSIKEEVSILCEEGVSDNYYKFDNLITHYASKASFHSRPDSMKSVLKIPVFANYYLLKMLQSHHGLAFVHPEEKRVISMTRTHWFEKYVSQAQRLRSELMKNRMVKR